MLSMIPKPQARFKPFWLLLLTLTLIPKSQTHTPCQPQSLKTQAPPFQIPNTNPNHALYGIFQQTIKTGSKKQDPLGSAIQILTLFAPAKNSGEKIFFRLEIEENWVRFKNGNGETQIETPVEVNGRYFFLFGQTYDKIVLKIVNLLNFKSQSKVFRVEGDLSFKFFQEIGFSENEEEIVFKKLKYSGELTSNLQNYKIMA
jgi:hypothetical protein